MNDFKDVITSVIDTAPKLRAIQSIHYVLCHNPKIQIRVSKPDSFDSYVDIVAKVTLYYKDEVVWNVLITYSTNLDAFCAKLKKKIELIERKERSI